MSWDCRLYSGMIVAAAGAVLSKAKMRRLVDMTWQRIDKIENGTRKKAILATAYCSLAALTGASAVALNTTLFTNPMLSLIPLGSGLFHLTL